jgi:acylphosphatase
MDDKVEILAQGDENKLTRLLATVRVGPPMAHVTQVTVEWSNPVVFYKRFSIAPSG